MNDDPGRPEGPAAPPTVEAGMRPLDARARTLWRIEAAIAAVPILLFAAGVAWVLRQVAVLPGWVGPAILALVLAWQVWEVAAMPGLRWSRWRWAVSAAEVDLEHGWLTRVRTVVPMARIQHVDTTRGPVERQLGLATVVLYTAAGASAIPALADADATAVRERIAALANVREDL